MNASLRVHHSLDIAKWVSGEGLLVLRRWRRQLVAAKINAKPNDMCDDDDRDDCACVRAAADRQNTSHRIIMGDIDDEHARNALHNIFCTPACACDARMCGM